MASLLVTQGQLEGQAFEFVDGEIVIGREEESCGITLPDEPKVSRQHSKIYRNEEGMWCLADSDSANGTLLNGEAISFASLQQEDVISIGGSTFVFRDDAVPAEESASESVQERAPAPKSGSDNKVLASEDASRKYRIKD